jgi:hypothetical protein
VLVGAAPAWFSDNLVAISAVALGLVAVFVVRAVQQATTRLLLLTVLVGMLLFVVVQRDQLAECGRTCSCRLAGLDVDVPACDTDDLVPDR